MVTMAEFLIITGLSGAGRSQAGATFEDLGWFV
ncbi:MAG: P-loop ATPase protein family, partial [Acidimicrobiaceae bacterium]|nr:P-loop ATPase protein family [Acidimicrobiaceae bacterium]